MDTNIIYCSSCGAANKSEARFCYKCGKPIQAPTPAAAAKPPTDFITLSCPSCGGKLQITPDMDRFACPFCGIEHLVRRSDGAVSLSPVLEGLKRVEGRFDQVLTSSDRMAAEQTVRRLLTEIPDLQNRIAQQETQVRNYGTRNVRKALALSIIIAVIGCIMSLCFTVQVVDLYSRVGSLDFGDVEWWGWVVGLLGISFALGGFIGLIVYLMSLKGWKETHEKALAELAQLRQGLQDRQQHLEQLRRYTVER